jgi:DNA-binding response OmpR family regulator
MGVDVQQYVYREEQIMRKRILLVDDEPVFTHLMRLNLEMWGNYEVREENESPSAIGAARAFGPDLILMDIMMPELNGVELAAKMEADKTLARTPIVFLTALTSPNGLGVSSDAAGHQFISKSLDFQHLLASIEAAASLGTGHYAN